MTKTSRDFQKSREDSRLYWKVLRGIVFLLMITQGGCDVMTASHVLVMSHVTAVGVAIGNANGGWQSQVIWISIYSPIFPVGNTDCFYPKKALLHRGVESCI